MPAFLELVDVIWVLKTKPTETDGAIIDAVAIEVNDVIRLLSVCPFEFGAESRKRRRAEYMDTDETAEGFHSIHQR
jgi:hypothetical protein